MAVGLEYSTAGTNLNIGKRIVNRFYVLKFFIGLKIVIVLATGMY